jgi:hypothetical protein
MQFHQIKPPLTRLVATYERLGLSQFPSHLGLIPASILPKLAQHRRQSLFLASLW